MEKPAIDRRLKLIVESILFATEKPLRLRDLNRCIPDMTRSDLRQALDELKAEYETLERSFVLKEIAGGFQLRTRSEYAPYILRLLNTSPTRLSRAAMETLAIIAYKQPILRHEIEQLRGVDVGGILKTLLEKNLIRILGRKNLPGKPLIYGTTKRFLEVFDLKDLEALPKLEEIEDLGSDRVDSARPETADTESPEPPADQASRDPQG